MNDDHPQLSSGVEVTTTTLSEFCRIEKVSRIDFIKMDVQGAEPFVLLGGRDVFSRHKPDLMIEISPYDLGLGGWTSRDLVALLEDPNYRCFPLLENGRSGSAIAADSIAPDYWRENVYCVSKEKISIFDKVSLCAYLKRHAVLILRRGPPNFTSGK